MPAKVKVGSLVLSMILVDHQLYYYCATPKYNQKSASGKFILFILRNFDAFPFLTGEGPFTVFAPTDEAFQKIPKETLDNLMKNETALKGNG